MNRFYFGVGLVVSVILCVAWSIRTNVELVMELKTRDAELYRKLGSPSLMGYEWVGFPGNKAYAEWLRRVERTDPSSRYAGMARKLKILRRGFYALWVFALVLAFAP